MRRSVSIDSGFHSLNIGAPKVYRKSGDAVAYSDMVRYIGRSDTRRYRGDQGTRRPAVRSRSKSRDRYSAHARQSYSYTPVISEYLASPMFDVLHNKNRDRSISLLPSSAPGRRASQFVKQSSSGINFISTCRVL